jgi:hypothetical protein
MASRVKIVHHLPGYVAIEKRITNMGDGVARAIASDAVDAAPIKTGAMVSTIRVSHPGRWTWHVSVGTDHWWYMEFGANPHGPILPVKKKALWWPGLPHPINVVEVHPGNKPRPFMRPAVYQRRMVWFTPTGGVAVT